MGHGLGGLSRHARARPHPLSARAGAATVGLDRASYEGDTPRNTVASGKRPARADPRLRKGVPRTIQVGALAGAAAGALLLVGAAMQSAAGAAFTVAALGAILFGLAQVACGLLLAAGRRPLASACLMAAALGAVATGLAAVRGQPASLVPLLLDGVCLGLLALPASRAWARAPS